MLFFAFDAYFSLLSFPLSLLSLSLHHLFLLPSLFLFSQFLFRYDFAGNHPIFIENRMWWSANQLLPNNLEKGTLRGVDQFTNMILEQCHERVYSTDRGVTMEPLGLYIIRGDNVYVYCWCACCCNVHPNACFSSWFSFLFFNSSFLSVALTVFMRSCVCVCVCVLLFLFCFLYFVFLIFDCFLYSVFCFWFMYV